MISPSAPVQTLALRLSHCQSAQLNVENSRREGRIIADDGERAKLEVQRTEDKDKSSMSGEGRHSGDRIGPHDQ